MDSTPGSSSATPRLTKKRKLPAIGYKIDRSTDPEKEKNEVRAILLQQKEFLQEQRCEKSNRLIDADWDPEISEARVTKNSGSSLEVFGHSRNRSIFLYPEEALYLIEMNKLQLFYNSVRMSLQRSYNVLLHPSTNITTDQYRIFKHFAVHGYKLFRHDKNTTIETAVPNSNADDMKKDFPYEEYFKNLRIFSSNYQDVGTCSLEITYDVHVPSATFPKSCRPPADFFLTVLRHDEDIFNVLQLVSSKGSNYLFASVIENTISVFNLHGIEIPHPFALPVSC